MKKIIFIIIILSFLLVGCMSTAEIVNLQPKEYIITLKTGEVYTICAYYVKQLEISSTDKYVFNWKDGTGIAYFDNLSSFVGKTVEECFNK
jgi:uncharacterized protein YcfL